jgi:pimeloyl-ACP methyl ester carboxylesterase
MTPVSRARACSLLLFAILAAFAVACDDDTGARPPAAVIETAQSGSREVRISSGYSTTPAKGDDEHTPVALDGRVFGSGPAGVILAPMRPADQTAWFAFATRLADSGRFTVLTFDFRGFGSSTGEKAFDRVDTDLLSAYTYMRDTLHITKVFLVGASMGGTASLVVGARVPVAGVVSISSPAQFENMDALATVPRIAVPKLFITSKDDVPAQRSLDQLVAAAGDPKDQHVYDGDAHGTDLLDGPYAPELEQLLLDFLTRN